MRTVWTESARLARHAAKDALLRSLREKNRRSGVHFGIEEESEFRRYVMACAIAEDMRAELEERIAQMFDEGQREWLRLNTAHGEEQGA